MASNAKTVDMTGQVSPTPSVESKEEDAVLDQGARTEQQERLARRSAEEYEAKKTAASGRSSGTASNSANSPPSVADAVANRPARPSDSKSKPAVAAVTPGAVPVTSPSPGPSEVKSARREEARQATSSDMPPDAESRPYSDSNSRPSSGKSKPAVAAVKPGVVAVDSPPSPTTARTSGKSRRTPSSAPTGVEAMNSSSFDSAALREERKAARHSGGPSNAVARVDDDGNLPEEPGAFAVVGSTVDVEIAVARRDSLRDVIWSYRCPICLVMCPLITGIALAIVFLRSQVTIIPAPTASPTVSMAPTNSRIFNVESALQEYGPPFDNDTAYDWLLYNDTWAPVNVTEGVEESSLWRQRYAAVSFYFATGGQFWKDNQGWLNTTTSICSWFGIACESDELIVEFAINQANNLVGSLPNQIFKELKGATRFQLWGNPLLAGSLPTEIGMMSNLEQLWLDRNGFTGTIPTEIGLLTNLNTFMLFTQKNKLSGTIPTEIGNLKGLQYLSLELNNLEGQIPTEVGSFSSLLGFWVSSNKLSGTIPTEVGVFKGATHFWAAHNNFTGTIPSEIGGMVGLIEFELDDNNLEGTIPTELEALTGVSMFTIDDNALTGGIPSFVETFWNVGVLGLGKNPLGGTIPAGIFELAQLTELRMSRGDFTGSLPSSVPLQNLETLYLAHNFLTGTVPEFATTFQDFTCFLGENNFTEVQNGINANCVLVFR